MTSIIFREWSSVQNLDSDAPSATDSTRPPTVSEVRRDLDAEAERQRIKEAIFAYGDEDPGDEGDIITFAREVPDRSEASETVTLRYVFLYSGGKWYGTGRQTPQGATWRTLVDYLIGLGIAPSEIQAVTADDVALSSSPLDTWL